MGALRPPGDPDGRVLMPVRMKTSTLLSLRAERNNPVSATPADVALNAVVEDVDGNIQFWALAFADGKPEFHSEVCRAMKLAGAL